PTAVEQVDPGGAPGLMDMVGDALGLARHGGEVLGRDIAQIRAVPLRHDEQMPVRARLDVHERVRRLGLGDRRTRRRTGAYPTEQAIRIGHRAHTMTARTTEVS